MLLSILRAASKNANNWEAQFYGVDKINQVMYEMLYVKDWFIILYLKI